MKFRPLVYNCMLAVGFLFAQHAQAAGPILAEAKNSSIDVTDLRGDALRIPAEIRKSTLANPEAVQQLTNNLVVRRALAAEAEATGMAQDPAVQGALRVARDRVLSDLLFARMDDANRPARSIVEAIAEANYKANPKRFDLPEEFGASHILIKSDTANAKEKALSLLAQLKVGADFAALARQHSQDNSSHNGGNLGYFAAGQMVGPFDAAVQRMKTPGELSNLVETQFGFHIIKFEGKRPAGVRPFENVKDILMREAEAKILMDKRREHTQKIQDTVKFDRAAIEAFSTSNQ